MKAVILAAGEGRRLQPLTNVRPKPMLPLANKPILAHVLEAVSTAGITEVVLVVGYKRERIQSYVGDGRHWDLDITYAVQEAQLGSGHALLQAESVVGSDIVVLNGDQIVDGSAIETIMETRERTGDNVLAATRGAETELYGVVDVEDGFAVDIHEKPPESSTHSELINAGVYAFGPEIFASIRDTETTGELGLPETLRQHLDSHPVRVQPYEGSWYDVSWPWELLTVNDHLIGTRPANAPTDASIHETATVTGGTMCAESVSIEPNASVLAGTTLGENANVGANAVLENTIVMSDVTVAPGVVLRDCIVGANAEVGAGSTAEGGPATVVIDGTIREDVRFGGVVGDNARLGGAVTIAPGTRLGNGSEVQSGSTLEGQFDPDVTIRRG